MSDLGGRGNHRRRVRGRGASRSASSTSVTMTNGIWDRIGSFILAFAVAFVVTLFAIWLDKFVLTVSLVLTIIALGLIAWLADLELDGSHFLGALAGVLLTLCFFH